MNKNNLEELANYLEDLEDIRSYIFNYDEGDTAEKLHQIIINLLQKYPILDLLIIKYSTNSIWVKFDIEDELKRRIEDVRKSYNWWNI